MKEKTNNEITEIKEIPFYDDTLMSVRDEDGVIWLAVKRACLNIGLSEVQARSQVEKVKQDHILQSNYRKIPIVQKEGNREVNRPMDCIKEDCVTLWLAKIVLTPTMRRENTSAVEKLARYQLEAQKVLHDYFMGTEKQKKQFYDDMGLTGEIVELKQEVKDLKENVQTLIDNSTINMHQQKALYNSAKERICSLLGGKKTQEYKQYSKLYFQNLWGDIKRKFDCSGSYHDLNPKDFKMAKAFIVNWKYIA